MSTPQYGPIHTDFQHTPHQRTIQYNGAWWPALFRFPMGMTLIGWLNFCVLQWLGMRLVWTYTHLPRWWERRHRWQDDVSRHAVGIRIRVVGVRFALPLTGWYLRPWRTETVVPMLCSLPVLTMLVVLAGMVLR